MDFPTVRPPPMEGSFTSFDDGDDEEGEDETLITVTNWESPPLDCLESTEWTLEEVLLFRLTCVDVRGLALGGILTS